jgi:predicted SAM-dependent methyltransferase
MNATTMNALSEYDSNDGLSQLVPRRAFSFQGIWSRMIVARMLKGLLKSQTTLGFRRSLLALLDEARLMRVHRAGLRRARSVPLPCKLHLGCGHNVKAGWVNVDLNESADIRLDMREPLPFPDSSATSIYSEHFFEHLSYEEGTRLLRESLRVLTPGGLISIGVPDAESMLWVYVADDRDGWLAGRQWHPAWCTTPMHSVNYFFRQDGQHRYAYDFTTLAGALRDSGFVNIRRRNWDVRLDLESRRSGTLYVDAEKPGCG